MRPKAVKADPSTLPTDAAAVMSLVFRALQPSPGVRVVWGSDVKQGGEVVPGGGGVGGGGRAVGLRVGEEGWGEMVGRMTRSQWLQWVEAQREEVRGRVEVEEAEEGRRTAEKDRVQVEVEEEEKQQVRGVGGVRGEVRVVRREVEGRDRRELSFDSQIAVDPQWGMHAGGGRLGGEGGVKGDGGVRGLRKEEAEKGLKGPVVRRGRWADRRVREAREEAKEGLEAKGGGEGDARLRRERKGGEVRVVSVGKLAALFPSGDDGQAS